jgi:hypothetical protein
LRSKSHREKDESEVVGLIGIFSPLGFLLVLEIIQISGSLQATYRPATLERGHPDNRYP